MTMKGREAKEKQRTKGIFFSRASEAPSVSRVRACQLSRGIKVYVLTDFGYSVRPNYWYDFNSEGIFDVKPIVLHKDR